MTAVKGFFGRMFYNYLKKTLTPANKRLIFLTSLAAYVKNDSNPDADVLKKLNELFSLGKDPSTLRFPMIIHPRIWNAFDMSELRDKGIRCTAITEVPNAPLNRGQLRILASHLIRSAPAWMHYDSFTVMRDDIFVLFKNAKALAPADTAPVAEAAEA